jgi:hypothetical protein
MQTTRQLSAQFRSGGYDSVPSLTESDSRRKPVFTFMKGTAMPRTDFADRSLLTAPLT